MHQCGGGKKRLLGGSKSPCHGSITGSSQRWIKRQLVCVSLQHGDSWCPIKCNNGTTQRINPLGSPIDQGEVKFWPVKGNYQAGDSCPSTQINDRLYPIGQGGNECSGMRDHLRNWPRAQRPFTLGPFEHGNEPLIRILVVHRRQRRGDNARCAPCSTVFARGRTDAR